MTEIRDMLPKLQAVEARIAAERGPFVLFALFRLEIDPLEWDLVISAPWAREDVKTMKYVDAELKKDLTGRDLLKFRRYVVIPPDAEELEELAEEHPVEHGKVIVRNREFGLQMVQKGYIITCRPPLPKAA